MIDMFEAYGNMQRVPYKQAVYAFESGEKVRLFGNKMNMDYWDTPWVNNKGELFMFVDKEKVFKKIGQDCARSFDGLVEDFEDEYCDGYNGKYAVFMVAR